MSARAAARGSAVAAPLMAASAPEPPEPAAVIEAVARALAEDLGPGDLSGRNLADVPARGRIVAEAELVVAGLPLAEATFRQVDPGVVVTMPVADGDRVAPGTVLLEVMGTGAGLLAAERVALNFLQRLSGIATLTRAYADAVAGTKAHVYDTRKTTPGLRALEKYAVRAGGGRNHRMGLYDMVLVKDNHVALAGGVAAAVERARKDLPAGTRVEVEVTSLAELAQALALNVDVVMLDNFALPDLKEAVRRAGGRVMLEASGGVSLETVRAIALAGVDIISVGRLTHSAPAAEMSMDITRL
jgi:nicotinate-nucleotide pyrophosphorylase (carboxylating)